MTGMLPTRIQQNGRMLLNVIIVVLLLALFLSSCSSNWLGGNGRGDWTLDLYGGYAISRINSNEILLIHKESPNDFGGAIVVPNYFITACQLLEPYICLEGIRTQKMSASEDELRNMVLCYYLVDTTNDIIIGPYDVYDDFMKYCSSIGLKAKDEWIKIDRTVGRFVP